MQITFHLRQSQRTIHPIRTQLDDDNRRLVPLDQRFDFRRERSSRRPPVYPIGEDVAVRRVLAVATLRVEIRFASQPMFRRRAARRVRRHGIFLRFEMRLDCFAKFSHRQRIADHENARRRRLRRWLGLFRFAIRYEDEADHADDQGKRQGHRLKQGRPILLSEHFQGV